MGNLYYGCKKCKGGISIFGEYVGFIKCEVCNLWIHKDKDPKFTKHIVKCTTCSFTVSFESMGEIKTTCLKCQCDMVEGIAQK